MIIQRHFVAERSSQLTDFASETALFSMRIAAVRVNWPTRTPLPEHRNQLPQASIPDDGNSGWCPAPSPQLLPLPLFMPLWYLASITAVRYMKDSRLVGLNA